MYKHNLTLPSNSQKCISISITSTKEKSVQKTFNGSVKVQPCENQSKAMKLWSENFGTTSALDLISVVRPA